MTSLGFPTLLFTAAPRNATQRMQEALATAQQELASQRKADLGTALGADVSTLAGLHWQVAALEGEQGRIASARNRAEATQGGLQAIAGLAGNVFETLSAARGSGGGQSVIGDTAREALASLVSLLDTSYGGTYLFGGLNGDTAPMQPFEGSAGQAAIRDSFAAAFGFSPDSAAAASITPDQMTGFLDGDFAALFANGAWQGTWVAASPRNTVTAVGEGQRIDSSASAAAPFAARLTQALTVMLTAAHGQFSQETRMTMLDEAMTLVAEAQEELVQEQARVGLAQQRLAAAGEETDSRLSRTRLAVEMLQGVDPYALATEINTLTTQLQASYTLTGRLSQMSLLSYI